MFSYDNIIRNKVVINDKHGSDSLLSFSSLMPTKFSEHLALFFSFYANL
uniref:Uncharacterized protein n=1 Tax=Arundo donax TaxID=35708 RepID=A0A0A9AE06_ARUDO